MSKVEELARKRKVCGGHTASTNRILGQIKHSTVGDYVDVPKITQMKQSFEDKLQSLSGLDNKILMLTPEEAIENKIVQADEFEEHIYMYTAVSRLDLTLKLSPTATVHTGTPAVTLLVTDRRPLQPYMYLPFQEPR